MKSIYFYLPIFVIHLAYLDEWWNQEEKAIVLVNTVLVCVRQPASKTVCLLTPCNLPSLWKYHAGVMVCFWQPCQEPHGVFPSELWIGGFPCPLTGIAQVLPSALSSLCCQVSEGRWKDLFLTSRFLAARHRPHNPKAVLPLCRAWIHPAPVLAGAARMVDTAFCPILLLSRAKLLFRNSFFKRKYFEMGRLFTSVLFFLPIFSFQRVRVSSPTFNTWARGHL